jgi:hypothetical protein
MEDYKYTTTAYQEMFGVTDNNHNKYTVIFQGSTECSYLVVVPSHSIVGFCESFGGFCIVIIFMAKCLIGCCEKPMFTADLIRNLY